MSPTNVNSSKKAYPPAFADPELNTWLKAAFDQIYACVVAAQPGVVLDSGSTPVTGSSLAIPTALTSVLNVVVSIDSGNLPLNEVVSAQPSSAGGGKIDIFVWAPTGMADTTPIASTTKRTVRWLATGTKP